jgi:hypothetical protein
LIFGDIPSGGANPTAIPKIMCVYNQGSDKGGEVVQRLLVGTKRNA